MTVHHNIEMPARDLIDVPDFPETEYGPGRPVWQDTWAAVVCALLGWICMGVVVGCFWLLAAMVAE